MEKIKAKSLKYFYMNQISKSHQVAQQILNMPLSRETFEFVLEIEYSNGILEHLYQQIDISVQSLRILKKDDVSEFEYFLNKFLEQETPKEVSDELHELKLSAIENEQERSQYIKQDSVQVPEEKKEKISKSSPVSENVLESKEQQVEKSSKYKSSIKRTVLNLWLTLKSFNNEWHLEKVILILIAVLAIIYNRMSFSQLRQNLFQYVQASLYAK